MTQLATGWTLDVERGPDWLFLRLHCDSFRGDETPQLAQSAWELMQQHFANRLVLELHDLPLLNSYLVGQLVLLHKRVVANGGLLRLAGLSDGNQSVLQLAHLGDRFPHFDSREAAVYGGMPRQPR